MTWKIVRSFPKIAIVLFVILGSTAAFALWWLARPHGKPPPPQMVTGPETPIPSTPPPPVEETKEQKTPKLPEKLSSLVLVGADLYDIDKGELLIPNWLGGIPQRLFYQPETNRLMAQTERGVLRFALDGTQDGVLGGDLVPAFTHDGKFAIYVKNGDIWTAEVDWKGFRFTNERQATKIGQFYAPFFAANIMLGSEKAIVVRNQNQLVRVDLLKGDVQPVRLPLGDLAKRRSPDGRFLVGDEPKNIYAYDVETAEAKNFPTGRDRLLDFQWLDDKRCAFIVAGRGVALYDRTKNAVEEVTALPILCNKIGGPSPDGRYVFCAGRQGIVIVDVKAKTVESFGTAGGDFGWVGAETLIYSRDVSDSSIRGTWLRTMGELERLVTADPYAVRMTDGGAIALMREPNLVLFASRTTLYRMKPDGSELKEVAKLAKPAERIQAVEIWGR